MGIIAFLFKEVQLVQHLNDFLTDMLENRIK